MLKQALHIFRKDIRYLRFEILLFILIAGLFATAVLGAPGALKSFVIGAIHLTSRVIHAEAIPEQDSRITRPYRWQSLVLAKLIFLAVCVIVPVGIARLFALAGQDYPIAQSLPPLFWSELLGFGALLAVATGCDDLWTP